jgi:predicted secreted acid phosphatase
VGWSTEVAKEPSNLTTAKTAVRAYVESGGYARDVESVAEQVKVWIGERVERRLEGEKLAIVLDIDETVLSNYPQMDREDFGYNRPDWVAWVDKAEAPVIEPMREVYREARKLGVAVVFLTGRSDPAEKPGTLINLEREGMEEYLRIYFKTAEDTEPTAAERKVKRRAEVEAEGWTIIASVGDQYSDFQGGHTERGFKLPNPFYEIP